MTTITIAREQTNITALDETLDKLLTDYYLGLSVHNGAVRVHLLDETPSDLVHLAEQIVQSHDPSQLTLGQQAEISKRQSLLQARNATPTALDTIAYDGTDPLLQQLANKLHWLEQEIRDLRDL